MHFKKKIEKRGGKCIAVQCDHSNDKEIKALFDRIASEQNGQLDVLVNNAYTGVQVYKWLRFFMISSVLL